MPETRAGKKQRTDVPIEDLQIKVEALTEIVEELLAFQQSEAQKVERLLKIEAEKNAKKFQAFETLLANAKSHPIQAENEAQYKDIWEQLPEKMALNDLPKFKEVENPLAHIRAFKAHMALKGVAKEIWPTLFPLSLEDAPQAWFYSMDRKKVDTFERIFYEFCMQYHNKTQTPNITFESLSQGDDEDSSESHTQWRETIPSTSFKHSQWKRKEKREITPIPISYTQAFKWLYDEDKLRPIGPTKDPLVKSTSWDPNSHCLYHQGRGHDTEDCFRLKHKIQKLIDSGDIPNPAQDR